MANSMAKKPDADTINSGNRRPLWPAKKQNTAAPFADTFTIRIKGIRPRESCQELNSAHCRMTGSVPNAEQERISSRKLQNNRSNLLYGPGRAELTSIIWYIYNEYLKKERELAEKAQEKVRKQVDRLRNGDNAGTGDGQKKR
jgi:hypothetical protein